MSDLPVLAGDIERVLVGGDLSGLTPENRVKFYNAVCTSLKLNPFTKPFDYIKLNGKTTLYAKKDATDQLRKQWDVSIAITNREKIGDVFVVTAKAKLLDREDEAIGAVPIAGLRGANLANALMKAETKAKRRVTLSICGLGLTDESEIETIKNVSHTIYNSELEDMNQALLDNTPAETPEPPKAEPEEEPRVEKEVQHVEKEEGNTVDVEAETSPFDQLPNDPEEVPDMMEPEEGEEVPEEKPKIKNVVTSLTVSKSQIQRLCRKANGGGWKNAQVYALFKKMTGKEQLRDVTQEEFVDVGDMILSNKPDILEAL